jgi:hypothetical protein
MNTLNFHNILALLDIQAFLPSVKLYQDTKRKFFKNTTEIDITRFVNGDDSSDNAP